MAEGVSKLTVVHDVTVPAHRAHDLGPGAEAGGGWAWILSDLKTLLETGSALESWAAAGAPGRGPRAHAARPLDSLPEPQAKER